MGAEMALHAKIALYVGWCAACYGGTAIFIATL
jgi:hypothetical protein